MPWDSYEESIKPNYNLIKRSPSVYQYENIFFLFYKWNHHLLWFDMKIDGFSSVVDDYDLNALNKPQIASYLMHFTNIISEYRTRGYECEVHLFCPKNDFLLDIFKYYISTFGISHFKYYKLNKFTSNNKGFFLNSHGIELNTKQRPNITYFFFIIMLDHLIRNFFQRSTFEIPLNSFMILLSQYIYNDARNHTKVIKIDYGDGINTDIGYVLEDTTVLEYNEGNDEYYSMPVRSWINRIVPEICNGGKLVKYMDKIYILEDSQNKEGYFSVNFVKDVVDRELYESFEEYFPQSYISMRIGHLNETLIDGYGIIRNIPQLNFMEDYNFGEKLLDVKYEIVACSDEMSAMRVVEKALDEIMNKIKSMFVKKADALGICPACERNGVIRGTNGYFCQYCIGFALWDKTVSKVLGEGERLSKHHMRRLLLPTKGHIIRLKYGYIKLTSEQIGNNKIRSWYIQSTDGVY